MPKITRRIIEAAPTDWPLPPLLARIYRSRGVQSLAELEKGAKALAPFDSLKGMAEAVRLLAAALEAQKRILIVGDFDADGATSSALCLLALKALGAEQVDFLVPNRFEYGYGLSPEIVAVAVERGAELLITVDNGISSIEGVAAAKAAGMAVLVTDHHLPGERLPDADAMVNPNLEGCAFPSKALAGVGVAFYLMLALRAKLRESGWFADGAAPGRTEPNLAELLDIVALGTVADVVPLDANNRILVHQGLNRIRARRCRPGILALCEVAGREPARLVASDLGFFLGPRLNAAGRLDEMSLGVSLLATDDLHQARLIAARLDSLNRERREIESSMQQEALAELGKIELGEVPAGIALYREDWHQGVIGILASRIKERFHRPVFAFAPANDTELKGSGRSIPGLHLRDLLDELDTANPGLILKFGGHAMAAGLSIRPTDFERFNAAFQAVAELKLEPHMLTGEILSDGELLPTEFNLETAQLLRDGGPWGQAFPEPVFDGHFKVVSQRLVGQKHLKLVLSPSGGEPMLDAIHFNADLNLWPNPAIQWVRAAFKLDINEYKGRQSVQLLVDHLEQA
ncbi:single-stranded-DNA-specific exonuclease RecJ [Gallaecimonas kandeliae]|uniref:single-stranded-DNA-specific exonuclease RecJ n=1 Tax=Gallaecimonas kandeliae TaxID=3029055 RepID=UPI0026499FC0|nr:single-stranded-DNA-specific exonuclease RecJ [Gallaecimonas kandeliae]WKE66377.1 single-stranded-DNA-specific exonuclease RecJ [Gallaecimonas kandeliae]